MGSSFQFHVPGADLGRIPAFLNGCYERGLEIKWFGSKDPHAFTSRYDSWKYFSETPQLPKTLKTLSTTCDMRVPLTFSAEDCRTIAEFIGEESRNFFS